MIFLTIPFVVVAITMSSLHYVQLQLAHAIRTKQSELIRNIYMECEHRSIMTQNQQINQQLLSDIDTYVTRLRLQYQELATIVELSSSPPRLLGFSVSQGTFNYVI